ncbi:MAG: nuclear transport factor 2 family protein [Shimia sp.]|uniref:nuclear transport factor 2 family protein n=1 Tax=Shimia sp. TaxID=1954381 RepID=UPI003B8B6B9F
MIKGDFKDISTLMQDYFLGLHEADSQVLRGVFHPKMAYVCATEGDPLYLDLEQYMDRIDARVAPAKRGDVRREEIYSIAFVNPRLAHVTCRMALMGRDYVDHLTLVPHDGAWRVVTKVFAYQPKEA